MPTSTPTPNDADFVAAFKFDILWEGAGYENVPGDSGGPTRAGITWIDGNQWRKANGLAPLSAAQSHACRLNYLTDAVIREIYFKRYWLPMHGAELPAPLDQVIFDCAVNTGCAQSVKMLQGVLGVVKDGVFGPQTLQATSNYIDLHGQGPLCFALKTRRDAFYEGLAAARPKDREFLPGWLNRDNGLLKIIKKTLGLTSACFLLFLLAGCGGGKMAPSPSPAPTIGVSVTNEPAAFSPNYLSSIAPARWKGDRVTWKITQGGNSSIPGVDIEKAVAAGFNEWLPAMDGKFVRFPVSFEEAKDGETPDVTIRMVESGELGSNVLGDTEVFINGEGYITNATMRLKKSLLPNNLKDVAAHEWGHALGVRGHSPFADDAMYYLVAWFRVPSQRDINTIASMYNYREGQPPVSRAASSTPAWNKPVLVPSTTVTLLPYQTTITGDANGGSCSIPESE